MAVGISTPNLPIQGSLDEVIGNKDSGTGMETARATVASLAAQISTFVNLGSAVTPIESRTLSAPPVSPSIGQNWIVGASPTGAWAGKANNIAQWNGTTWLFTAPQAGSVVNIIAENALYSWNATASAWQPMLSDSLAENSWSALSVITGVKAGQRAEVYGDAGTHTDPVTGAAGVANSGIYSWSVSPAGWQWLSADTLSGKANIDSPNFTGIPTAPTASAGTGTTQIATTAFVTQALLAAPFSGTQDIGAIAVADPAGYVIGYLTNDGAWKTPRCDFDFQGDNALEVADKFGYVVAKIDATGVNAPAFITGNGGSISAGTGQEALVIADKNGWVIASVDSSGTFHARALQLGDSTLNSDYTKDEINERNARALGLSALLKSQIDGVSAAPVANYNHVFVYGQSLGSGYKSWPAKTTVGRSDVVMVGQSVRPNSSASVPSPTPNIDGNFHTAIATVEESSDGIILTPSAVAALPVDDPAEGEEVGVASMLFARKLFLQKLGVSAQDNQKFAVSNVSVAGTYIEQLSKGASPEYFNRLRVMATAGKNAATALGATYGVAAIFYLQGEYNYLPPSGGYTNDKTTYKNLLKQLYFDFVSDIAVTIAGQSDPPVMITYQSGGEYAFWSTNLSIGQAQLELSQENNSIYLAAPAYPVTNKSDGHLDANGQRWLAMQFGKVFHEVCVLRRKWKPLSPINVTFRGSTVLVDFHVPSPPLQFQASYVASTATTFATKGFSVTDSIGAVTINDVSIVGDAVVQISCARDLSGPVTVYYGTSAAGSGGGNLCDSDPQVAPFNYDYSPGSGDYAAANIAALVGKPYPLWNWCVSFAMPATSN